MKYLLLFLFCSSLLTVSAQETNRRESPQTAEELAVAAADRFEGRLTRLREALDNHEASSMVRYHADLLGDVRAMVDHESEQAPDSERLIAMQAIFGKLEAFVFDPGKSEELRAYLPDFEAFLGLMRRRE